MILISRNNQGNNIHILMLFTFLQHHYLKKIIDILGKAKNLTSRLFTYNKTDEHEVILSRLLRRRNNERLRTACFY